MSELPYRGPDATTIRGMFAKIALGYDTANSILSLGIHHLWKRKLVRAARVQPGMKILDVASGTGDLALRFQRAMKNKGTTIATDFCAEMLDEVPRKAEMQGLSVTSQVADATSLPFPDAEFDRVSISFGIRNVEQPARAFAEMARVLKPGGELWVLEFGQPRPGNFARIYEFYSRVVLPRIGGFITGDGSAYQYLESSSARFPCREALIDLAQSQGAPFSQADFEALTFGIAYLYRFQK